jgi:hypothetical protein
MLEIYNEQVYDLLNSSSSSNSNLDIRQHPDGGIYVPGLRQVAVSSLNDVMKIFAEGSRNRSTASTNINEHSSRSHLIMSVIVTSSSASSSANQLVGKLHLVDLAGSERVSKSGVTGAAMKEAQHINKSLAALGDVLEALDQKSKHIPYRNSKLTYLLQDCLNGNSHTMMIVTTCPTERYADETLFTLQFATRIRNIRFGASSAAAGPTAKKMSSAYTRNLEEAVKVMKNEMKESKKQTLYLEDTINDLKREMKKLQEKSSASASSVASEKKNDIQMLALQKQCQDLAEKYSEEKELRWKLLSENENLQKSIRKLQSTITSMTNAGGSSPKMPPTIQPPSPNSGHAGSLSAATTPRHQVPLLRKLSATSLASSSGDNPSGQGPPVPSANPPIPSGLAYPSPRSAAAVRASVQKAFNKSAPASRSSPSLGLTAAILNLEAPQQQQGLTLESLHPATATAMREVTPHIDDLLDEVKQPEEEVDPLPAIKSADPAGEAAVASGPSPLRDPPEISDRISAFLLATRPTPRPINAATASSILQSISPTNISSSPPPLNLPSATSSVINLQVEITSPTADELPGSPSREKVVAATAVVPIPACPDKSISSSSAASTHLPALGKSKSTRNLNSRSPSASRAAKGHGSESAPETPVSVKTAKLSSKNQSRSNSRNRNRRSTLSDAAMSNEQPEDTGSSAAAAPMRRQSSIASSSSTAATKASSSSSSVAAGGVSVASRSKDALIKHQERMDRIREQKALEAKLLADKLHFSRQSGNNSSTTS